jgi:hypothetical protein
MKNEADEMIIELSHLFVSKEKISDCHAKLKNTMQRIKHVKARMFNESAIKRKAEGKITPKNNVT